MKMRQFKRSDNYAAGERMLAWHVFHWKERYAVDTHNWPAERGLLFVRQVTAPVDTESTHYLGQLRDLESLAGDWRQYHVWKSLWEDLRALTATQSRIHQGYLLDEHQQPLKEAQIASRLHADLDRRALKALSAVNLMERVPLPSFGEIKRAQAEQNENNGRDKSLCAAQSRARKTSCTQAKSSPSPPTTQPITPKGAEEERAADPVRHTGTKPCSPSFSTPTETIAAVTPMIRKLGIFVVVNPPAVSRGNDHQWTSDTEFEMKGHRMM